MNRFTTHLRTVFVVASACWLIGGGAALAQIDRVYDKEGDNVSGTIVATNKNGVQLKKGDSTQTFVSGDVVKIMYGGEPAPLTKAREFALDGQYSQAMAELKNINPGSIKSKYIQADNAFFRILCQSKLALSGKGDKTAAAGATIQFVRQFGDSWHVYEAAKLLGDLALALNKHTDALKYYSQLENSPSGDTKIESVYLTGLVHLNQGDANAASAEFDKVIELKPQTSTAVRLQTLSKAGKAVAVARGGNGAEGLKLVNQLIADLNPTDTEMAARIYNAQGASYEASDDAEGAIIAYLHTHLMFAMQADAHAEALKRLAELWPQVGKPERAAEARQELKERYPGF